MQKSSDRNIRPGSTGKSGLTKTAQESFNLRSKSRSTLRVAKLRYLVSREYQGEPTTPRFQAKITPHCILGQGTQDSRKKGVTRIHERNFLEEKEPGAMEHQIWPAASESGGGTCPGGHGDSRWRRRGEREARGWKKGSNEPFTPISP